VIQRPKSRVPQRFGADVQLAQFARLTYAESTRAAAVRRHSLSGPVPCRTNRRAGANVVTTSWGSLPKSRSLRVLRLASVADAPQDQPNGTATPQTHRAKIMLHVEHRSLAQKETRQCRASQNHSVPRGTYTSQVTDAAASPRDVTSRCWPHGPGQRSSNRVAGSRRARRAVRTTRPAGSSR